MSKKYLKTKLTRKSYRDIERGINQACKYFNDKNVKDFNGADIEDYLFSIKNISEKTRYNKCSSLHDFWNWLLRRGVINMNQMPIFPKIDYDLGYRKIIDWETQQKIIDEVNRITKNQKVGFGIELLTTYPALRPGDLLKIKESDIDLKYGEIIIHNPTKRKNKFKQILLTDEHINRFKDFKELYPGFPSLLFFRHIAGISGTKADKPFGHKQFYKWWVKACENLGIKGVDLYSGTRHSTTTEIARRYGEDKAIKATGHETNKAFRRYCQVQDNTALEMARLTMNERQRDSSGNVVDFKKYANKS